MNLAYKYHRLKLGLGLFFIFQIPTYSQSFPVKTYTLANGLNTNFIHDVTQDKQGNMWFATEFGVSVYDGYSFKNYREEDGLPQTEYFQIKADSNNNIIAVPSWSTQHIAIFTNKKWQLINSLPSLKGNNNYYTSFDINYEKNKLILYLGTLEGVYKYSDNKWSNISVREGLINNQINTIKNNNNKLYVCTESGLSIIENEKIDNSLNSVLKSSSKKIRSIEFENHNKAEKTLWLLGEEWIGTIRNGKFKLVTLDNRMRSVPPAQRQSHVFMTYDRKDRFYYGTELNKLYLEKSTNKITSIGQENGFTDSGGSAAFLDRESNLWFTSYRGIDKISNMPFLNYFKENGLLENEVTAILEVEPDYLIFGHNYGLTFLKKGKFSTVDFTYLSRNRLYESRIMDLCKDSLGNVWIAGSELGLGKIINGQKIVWLNENKTIRVRSVKTDINGTIWVGSEEGLYKVSNDNSRLDLMNNKEFKNIRKIFCDKDGSVYGATAAGLAFYKNGHFKKISDDKLKLGNSSYAIDNYTGNKKLIGTAAGLFILENGLIKKFQENNFSIDRKVFSITHDKNNHYWFGTDDGIIKWDGKESRRFSVENGLAGTETNRSACIIDSLGEVWIGTYRGLSRYIPLYDTGIKPPVITSIQIEDSKGNLDFLDKPLEKSHNENSIFFRFRAISLVNEKFIQYRVKLEGLDKNWIDVGYNNYIRYTHLPPGNYRLSVQTKNLESDWSQPVLSSILKIDSPFYVQWWFILLSLSIAILFLFLGYTYFLQKKYSSKLEEEVKTRTKSLQESEGKLRTILENAPNTISAINSKGEILFINQPDEKHSDNRSTFKSILDNIPKEKIIYVQNILSEVFKDKKTVRYEINYKDHDNIEHWLENSISPVISDQEITEAITISKDVTERKLYEAEKEEIEERQNAIFKVIPLILYNGVAGSRFSAAWITENVSTITGYDPDKFLSEEYFWESRIHPDDKENVLHEFNKLKSGTFVKVEYRFLCADGLYKWFLDYAVPKRIENSDHLEYIGIWLEISERKQMQERLVKLNECLLSFGVDPIKNIDSLVTLCCNELNAAGAYYSSSKNGKSITAGNLGTSINFDITQICNDIAKGEKSFVHLIRDLHETEYAQDNSDIIKYSLKTLLGIPVAFGESTKGSLCVVYQEDKTPTEDDQKLLSIISSAIAIEEERHSSQKVIQNSLQEKEILLKELHHRVKNNLQVISSLLFLQSADIEDEKIQSLFQESTSRVRSMALVYEKLFQSADFINLNFSDYVNNLVSYLIDTYSIKIYISKKIEIDDISMPIDTVMPCGLIINELVTNSIKYAFPDGFVEIPEIKISLKHSGKKFILTVADNGIGIPDDISLANEQKTLGLKLINMLTAQLYGEIKLERNHGTEYQITFSEKI